MDHEKKPGGQAGQKPRPSSSGDLLSSAKVVADAAKASLRHETDKVDKGRVAGAAADLLGAASRYGKLEEKSMGKYVDKAEGYLRGYHSSHSAHAGAATTATTATATTGYSSPSHAGEAAHSAAAAAGAGGGKSGYGEYVKVAQGLLNAHSGGGGGSGAGAGGQHSGGGGYGDYIKMAEGFLKKH